MVLRQKVVPLDGSHYTSNFFEESSNAALFKRVKETDVEG